jgi:cytochrome b pre-mRNA-processing protein 3
MLGWLKGRSLRRRTGQQLYERIVAQARDPGLYEACGVPDTMDGRLEMVLLHTVLVLDRLQSEGPAGQRLGQHLMEQLVAGVDDALRRIGLGDDSVAPRIKRLAGALMERTRDYKAAFQPSLSDAPNDPSAATPELEAAFFEHVYGVDRTSPPPETEVAARHLAIYTRNVRTALASMPSGNLLSGKLTFPPVATETGLLETRS